MPQNAFVPKQLNPQTSSACTACSHSSERRIEHKAAKKFFEDNNILIKVVSNTTLYQDRTKVSVYYVEGWQDELEFLLQIKTGCKIEVSLNEIDDKTLELYQVRCYISKYLGLHPTQYSLIGVAVGDFDFELEHAIERNVRNDVNDDFFRSVHHSGVPPLDWTDDDDGVHTLETLLDAWLVGPMGFNN